MGRTGLGQRGIAIFEMLALLVVFVVLFGLTLGFWGAIHSATLQSISARHYAFEVVNNRTHFEYHRDWELGAPSGSGKMLDHNNHPINKTYRGDLGMILFYITGRPIPKPPAATTRGLNFFKEVNRDTAKAIPGTGAIPGHETGPTANASYHQNIFNETPKKVNPLWLMTGYGICLEFSCGQ